VKLEVRDINLNDADPEFPIYVDVMFWGDTKVDEFRHHAEVRIFFHRQDYTISELRSEAIRRAGALFAELAEAIKAPHSDELDESL
jgi:hypothetical protein